jgi:putative SOS response-associated peptidase YedK
LSHSRGLWDIWKNPNGENDLWLDPEVEDFEAVKEILKPYDPSSMRQSPVSPKLNNANSEDPALANRIEAEAPTQAQLF